MKILVTGAHGFLGKNLVAHLKSDKKNEVLEITKESSLLDLEQYTQECDFVFHLAGVNRPKKDSEFMEGNFNSTSQLLNFLKKSNNNSPVLLTSSIQAEKDNAYGISKKAGEKLVFNYASETNNKVYVYRLPNLFGKWSKPNYNSVVATFCYNIARDVSIQINEPDLELELCYIDDVLEEFDRALINQPTITQNFGVIPTTHRIKLGDLANLLQSFKASRENLSIPNMDVPFIKKLYSTYLSFLPENQFAYNLKMNADHRGSFTEFIRTKDRGQVSVNISKPGVTKGSHWHHTKNEKFLVVSGEGVIRFRKVESEEVIEYKVSGDVLQVVDIPPGYTHSIVNTGENDLVTLMWVNECFNLEKPDTYFLEV